MKKIGLFYGSDSGYTMEAAREIENKWANREQLDVFDIGDSNRPAIADYDFLILGLSTWYDGELQSDWDNFFETFQNIDFSGKLVALFGLGDQYCYSDYFVDGMGIIGKVVLQNGGTIIGQWSTKGYEYDASKAEIEPGVFIGLAIDEENQAELTSDRIRTWVKYVKTAFQKHFHQLSEVLI